MLRSGKQAYLGGSCFDNSARAAKAVAGIVQQVGKLLAQQDWVRIAKLPWSVGCGRRTALLVVIVHAPFGHAFCFATDCAAVFYGFRNLVGAGRRTSTRAGLWR